MTVYGGPSTLLDTEAERLLRDGALAFPKLAVLGVRSWV